MTKYIPISKYAWIAFIIALITSFLMASVSHAQSASSSADQAATRYGVTFPIAALGNCTDLKSCKTFCDDPVNKETCITFAKSKGFYQEDALTTQKEAILVKAKSVLGCDSETACLNFCAIPINQDKCSSFANKTNLQGGVVAQTDNQTIVNKAKEVLGCSSEASCKAFCENDKNRAKCDNFAKQVGIRGGEEKIGPGGCTSEATCQAFCSDPNNFQLCSGFAQGAGSNFSGPGGCNSPQSCQTYCQQNPRSCSDLGGSSQNPQSALSPAEMCNKTPNCAWTGNNCQCGLPPNPQVETQADKAIMCARYACTWTGSTCNCSGIGNTYNSGAAKQGCESAKGTWTGTYCKMPESGTSGGSGYNNDTAKQGCIKAGGTWSDDNYCHMPNNSGGSGVSSEDQAAACRRGGCSWSGQACQCPTNNTNNYNNEQAKQSCLSAGGTWSDGNYCHMPNNSGSSGGLNPGGYYNGTYEDPATACTRGGGCTWTGSSCSCPSSGSGSSPSNTPPSTPAPATSQTSAPQPSSAPQQTSTTSTATPPPSTPQPSSAVKGISAQGNIWTFLLSLFQK